MFIVWSFLDTKKSNRLIVTFFLIMFVFVLWLRARKEFPRYLCVEISEPPEEMQLNTISYLVSIVILLKIATLHQFVCKNVKVEYHYYKLLLIPNSNPRNSARPLKRPIAEYPGFVFFFKSSNIWCP